MDTIPDNFKLFKITLRCWRRQIWNVTLLSVWFHQEYCFVLCCGWPRAITDRMNHYSLPYSKPLFIATFKTCFWQIYILRNLIHYQNISSNSNRFLKFVHTNLCKGIFWHVWILWSSGKSNFLFHQIDDREDWPLKFPDLKPNDHYKVVAWMWSEG